MKVEIKRLYDAREDEDLTEYKAIRIFDRMIKDKVLYSINAKDKNVFEVVIVRPYFYLNDYTLLRFHTTVAHSPIVTSLGTPYAYRLDEWTELTKRILEMEISKELLRDI